MATLNLSLNGPSIKSSYQGVVNGPAPSSSSPTYAQWAVFTVQAPLQNAFQDGGGSKESILKVQGTGDGDLLELADDFSEGRIQFAFVKVRDPNTSLPKYVLIAWCGAGVPERTKSYFTSHLSIVSKTLHGYHVQITARSENDIEPEAILQKVADSSGAKYSSSGPGGPTPATSRPPVAKKPVFTPTSSSAGSALVAARNRRDANVDDDGWGADAPPVTRTQLEKVESAYKPTKVDISQLRGQKQDSFGFRSDSRPTGPPSDVIGGGYQPVGKVDIAAIRAQAQKRDDDRPTLVKGAYEPVGKVDIAAIRARAQRPTEETGEQPKAVSERSAAFSQPLSQSERLTSLPKPKVAHKFGAAAAFTGTKAPTPGVLGFSTPPVPGLAPVGAASRTFADQGGKTPAQLWAEKKAGKGNFGTGSTGSTVSPPMMSPIAAQTSGSEWRSGYAGKSWAPVHTPAYGRAIAGQKTGETDENAAEAPASPGNVAAIRDRFKDSQPMLTAPHVPKVPTGDTLPPHLEISSRPSGGAAIPGLPIRPPPVEEGDLQAQEEEQGPEHSPVRIAMPVARREEVGTHEDPLPPRRIPSHDEGTILTSQAPVTQATQGAGKRALVQYDYEKAEDNEIELREGEYVTDIDMVDEDWWTGTNSQGHTGLFPSNYVELVAEDDMPSQATSHAPASASASRPEPKPEPEPEPEPATTGGAGPTATALFDYEAAEDNELGFSEGAEITNLEFPDDDWWFGHHDGKSGLFPANYVQLDS